MAWASSGKPTFPARWETVRRTNKPPMDEHQDVVRFCLVRRTYVVESEAHRARVDRDFDACIYDRSGIHCLRGTRVVSAVRSVAEKKWGLQWDRDVEALRIYNNDLTLQSKNLPDQDLTVDDLDGEVHIWERRPRVYVLSTTPKTTYECMRV